MLKKRSTLTSWLEFMARQANQLAELERRFQREREETQRARSASVQERKRFEIVLDKIRGEQAQVALGGTRADEGAALAGRPVSVDSPVEAGQDGGGEGAHGHHGGAVHGLQACSKQIITAISLPAFQNTLI